MAVDDSAKRMTILQTLYNQYLGMPEVVTTNEQLGQMTELTPKEVARCVEYLKNKRYVTVDYFFGGEFYVKIAVRGIDSIENPPSAPSKTNSNSVTVGGGGGGSNPRPRERGYTYDVAVSYAGENKDVALDLHKAMEKKGIKCFLALLRKSGLWGQKLDQVFEEVFSTQARYVIILASKEYRGKKWTDFELTVALEAAKKRHGEYVLPVRLDDTVLLGIQSAVGYLDYKEEGSEGIAEALAEKLSNSVPGTDSSSSHASKQPARSGILFVPPETRTEAPLWLDDVCQGGPFSVDPGSYSLVPLSLYKGDLVTGTLDETNGDAFDWYIINEKNMTRFKRREEFGYARGDEGQGAYHLTKWKTPKEGPWYLVLSAQRKQYPRNVHVRLRRAHS